MKFATLMLATAALALSGAAVAQKQDNSAGNIASQPVRDVGLSKQEIPPILVSASQNPYLSLKTCPQIASNIKQLSDVLGTDFGVGSETNEKRSNVAAYGGRAVVNSLIPFRGIVREVSGAAPAERRLNAAVDAGFARRGYLRGLQGARGCRK